LCRRRFYERIFIAFILSPISKTHKSHAIGRLQLDIGVVGIAVVDGKNAWNMFQPQLLDYGGEPFTDSLVNSPIDTP
jgi:hypothetical protein